MPSTSHELVGDIPCDDCLNRRGSLMLTSKEIRVHAQSPVAQYVPLLSSWHLGWVSYLMASCASSKDSTGVGFQVRTQRHLIRRPLCLASISPLLLRQRLTAWFARKELTSLVLARSNKTRCSGRSFSYRTSQSRSFWARKSEGWWSSFFFSRLEVKSSSTVRTQAASQTSKQLKSKVSASSSFGRFESASSPAELARLLDSSNKREAEGWSAARSSKVGRPLPIPSSLSSTSSSISTSSGSGEPGEY